MAAARPLKDVFAELTGDDAGRPDAALAAAGHGDLPADLVAEAVVSYADTAPVEVAEHLSPFVMAHSGVLTDDVTVDGAAVDGAADWADLLATAPPVEAEFDTDDPAGGDAALGGPDTVDGLGGPDTVDGLGGLDAADRRLDDVDFGGGAARSSVDEPATTGTTPSEPAAPEVAADTADAPEAAEFDGEVFDSTAPIDLSEVDDLDAGDDVDPAELDG